MTLPRLRSLTNQLFRPVPNEWLGFYRISFGAVMLYFACKYLLSGTVNLFFVLPIYHFPYDGFEWVTKSDFALKIGDVMVHAIHLEFVILGILALLIMLGAWFRIASILFAGFFVHIFLLDKCYYQNHYYLVALLSCILPFLPANQVWSIDALRRTSIRSRTTPVWTLWLLRFQIGIPYFYGGIAKVSEDWFGGQPMRLALPSKVDRPWIGGPWFAEEWLVQVFVWGGLLFDLLVVPALLYRRTRVVAFVACLCFHLMNSLVWTIGIFPWLMILATTVFFEPDWPRRLAAFFGTNKTSSLPSPNDTMTRPSAKWITAVCLSVYVTWQVLFPFRHVLYPGNSNWDEYTHHFSWHMLLRAKETGLRVYATHPVTERSSVVDLTHYVTARQLATIGRDPRMMHRLCLHIHDDLMDKGYGDVEIRVLALVSMNGRKPQLLIDPTVDLAHMPLKNGLPDWIVPLYEPFRRNAWELPRSQWERSLDLDLPPQMTRNPNSNKKPQPTI